MRFYEYLKEEMSDEEALQIFGLSRDAVSNKALVKKRYRELAKLYHPDKISKKDLVALRHQHQNDQFQPADLMVKLNLAYEKIKKMKPEQLSKQAAANLMKDLGAIFGGKKPDWANLDPKKGVYA